MDLNTYIKERIDPQVKWYDKKSKSYKRYFFAGNIFILIISTLIPFLTSFDEPLKDFDILKYSIGFMGVLITVITGMLNLFGFYQKWLLYRTTSEKLKSEKFVLTLMADRLDEEEQLEWIQKLEGIIMNENQTWLQESKSKTSTNKKPK
ncbi:MAG: DUF4231 domain-containing protein [Crocinitomix sp.]|nr:DUF4231 domain-containing protein [Crocinitomix sp.]